MLSRESGGRPVIAILLAVYEPRLDWLGEQLRSLNRQTILDSFAGPEGSAVKLYIRDDASRRIPAAETLKCVQSNITRMPFEFSVNDVNRGSSAVFEQLTTDADGVWFAYCDQDDIWEADKLEKEWNLAMERGAVLVCSDLRMIDADGRVLADSITDLRPRHRFAEGSGLAGRLIYRNYVAGCTVLMSAAAAKQSVPFAKSMVQDHYLAFYAALYGMIAVCREPLVRYRQHGGNQTGVLCGIHSKQDYIRKHIGEFAARSEELGERFGEEEPELKRARLWCAAREKNAARERGGMRQLWKLRETNPPTSMFELIGLRLPEPLFRLALRWIRNGRI